jgi:hypothetical protein
MYPVIIKRDFALGFLDISLYNKRILRLGKKIFKREQIKSTQRGIRRKNLCSLKIKC